MALTDLAEPFKYLNTVWVHRAVEALIYVTAGAILSVILTVVLRRFRSYSVRLVRDTGRVGMLEREKQTQTIATLMKRVGLTAIWALTFALALKPLGFDIGPVLAGAGVAGIAIGFAAQSILKDWINGLFLLTEGQIRVNDIIKIGELGGVVEQMSLRTIALRAYDGSLHVISNGTITTFSNLTLTFSYCVFDVSADFGEDPQRMMDAMREVEQELRSDPALGPAILEPLEIAGVDQFAETGVVVRARMKTEPGQQWPVRREFNRRLKKRCDELGIIIATARRAVRLFEKEEPLDALRRWTGDQPARAELKSIIREVLNENEKN